jgi:predicted RNA-binding protein YlqC (UPF0109 family)
MLAGLASRWPELKRIFFVGKKAAAMMANRMTPREQEARHFVARRLVLHAMQEFLQFVIPLLIDYREEMVLTPHEEGRRTIFLLKLRQSDVGKVVGKHGLTITALRNLLAASAARHGLKAQLEIIE